MGAKISRFFFPKAAGVAQDVQRTPNLCCVDISNYENAQTPPQFHERPRKLEKERGRERKKKSAKIWSSEDGEEVLVSGVPGVQQSSLQQAAGNMPQARDTARTACTPKKTVLNSGRRGSPARAVHTPKKTDPQRKKKTRTVFLGVPSQTKKTTDIRQKKTQLLKTRSSVKS